MKIEIGDLIEIDGEIGTVIDMPVVGEYDVLINSKIFRVRRRELKPFGPAEGRRVMYNVLLACTLYIGGRA